MNALQDTMKSHAAAALLLALVAGPVGPAQAADISGLITSTVTVSENSKLVGPVTCKVTAAPCLRFTAPNIRLRLNGFSITGQNNGSACSASVLNIPEALIDTNGMNRVSISGPGLLRQATGPAVVLSGDNSSLRRTAIIKSCAEGVRVFGQGNRVEANTIVRSSLYADPSAPHFFAGVWLTGAGRHEVERNEIVGGGSFPGDLSHGAYGIFVDPNSKNNEIEGNSLSGNTAIGILVLAGSTGNRVRRNQILGTAPAFDLADVNPAGSSLYADNLCETTNIPGICTLANIAGHENPDRR